MTKTSSVSLESVPDLGAIHFLRAEWRKTASRSVLIRYSVDGQEKKLGLRLDLDKKAILDPMEDAKVALSDEIVSDRITAIWNIVAKARARDQAFSP